MCPAPSGLVNSAVSIPTRVNNIRVRRLVPVVIAILGMLVYSRFLSPSWMFLAGAQGHGGGSTIGLSAQLVGDHRGGDVT